MERANAKVDATLAPHGPFWYLFGILKLRIKKEDWASKDMSSLKTMMVAENC